MGSPSPNPQNLGHALRRLSLLGFIAFAWPTSQATAQSIAEGLPSPVSVVTDKSQTAFVLFADGRIVTYSGEKSAEILNAFPEEPGGSHELTKLALRDHNLLSTIGQSREQLKLVTHRLVRDQAPKAVAELSAEIPLRDSNQQLLAAAASDFAFYFAVGMEDGPAALLRLPATRSAFGSSRVIWRQADSQHRPTAMCISPRGHLAVAMAEGATTKLVLLHTETGKLLQEFQTEMNSIHALAASPSGVLIGAGRGSSGEPGIFRLDVAIRGTKQRIVGSPLSELDNVIDLACPTDETCFALVGGPRGQLVKLAPLSR
jgi:hypothetical protein